jgi:hypothetical protein
VAKLLLHRSHPLGKGLSGERRGKSPNRSRPRVAAGDAGRDDASTMSARVSTREA